MLHSEEQRRRVRVGVKRGREPRGNHGCGEAGKGMGRVRARWAQGRVLARASSMAGEQLCAACVRAAARKEWLEWT